MALTIICERCRDEILYDVRRSHEIQCAFDHPDCAICGGPVKEGGAEDERAIEPLAHFECYVVETVAQQKEVL